MAVRPMAICGSSAPCGTSPGARPPARRGRSTRSGPAWRSRSMATCPSCRPQSGRAVSRWRSCAAGRRSYTSSLAQARWRGCSRRGLAPAGARHRRRLGPGGSLPMRRSSRAGARLVVLCSGPPARRCAPRCLRARGLARSLPLGARRPRARWNAPCAGPGSPSRPGLRRRAGWQRAGQPQIGASTS